MTTEVNVLSYTQRIVVDAPTKSVSVILAGPRGPSSGGVGHVEITGDTMTGPLILSGDATADLGAVTKQQMEAAVSAGGGGGAANPAGTFIQGGWSTDPDGYLILDGRTIVGGVATYPELAAIFPNWVSGGDLILPDADGAVLMYDGAGTPGDILGTMSRTITESQLPSHQHSETQHVHTTPQHNHTNDHDHAQFNTASGGGHNHNGRYLTTSTGSGSNADLLRPHDFTYTRIDQINTTDGAHVHAINVPAYTGSTGNASPTTNQSAASNTGLTGGGNPIDITPRRLVSRTAVKT